MTTGEVGDNRIYFHQFQYINNRYYIKFNGVIGRFYLFL